MSVYKQNKEIIDTIEKVVTTLVEWSGEPPEASEDTIIIQATLPQQDITYGDLLSILGFINKVKSNT